MDFNEKSHTQIFWLKIVRDAFGVNNPEDYFEFEKRVEIDHTKFIDAYVPSTGTIIEQKSPGKNLDDAFSQAKNYHDWLPLSQRGRYIITCDFSEIHVHDMEEPTKPPEIIPVESANKDNLSFLITPGELRPLEVTVSIKAGELVRKLYDSLRDTLDEFARQQNYTQDQYNKERDNINMFCVRLVFLLYAEDAGLFAKGQFHDYFKPRAIMADYALENLSLVINTPVQKRKIKLNPALKAFPYVDGGLFADEVDLPLLDDESLRIIIEDMAEKFNWSGISPVIFGAIFESTLNEETRRQEGIHYTSPENIHKLIDPLFLDGLNETLATILAEPQSESRSQKLRAFQDKLAALRFLDPACGSGNFLTESFISLRKLENKLLAAIPENERPPVKVSITQFHGIEANNFAVNIARTALWISDHQMWKETRNITDSQQPPLPLKDYHHIKEGSAMDALENLGWKLPGWNIPHEDMLYIMGNPPFVGYYRQKSGQRKNVEQFFGKMTKADYVACWFAIASEYVQDKNTKAAFLATNSIVQGEQVGYVFKKLRERWGIKIDFAHQPFVWRNELPDPSKMAHVHVVIISISTNPPEKRRLYAPDGTFRLVDNINFYLHEGPDEDIALRTDTPICANAPAMKAGNMPADKGNLIIEAEDYAAFIKREPRAAKYIKRYMMGREFLHNLPRYCLWLVDASPQEIHDMPLVYKRVKACKEFRAKSSQPRLANTPHLFREQMNPAHYVAIPLISSEKRRYIPMGWLDDSVIPGSGGLVILPDATLYHFGVLTSRVSMAWMRYVGGRMKSDYRYTVEMVYNTFVWPGASGQGIESRDEWEKCTLSAKHYKLITKTAQGILDARSLHPESSFAAMYNDALMPVELRRAHERNDRAVCRAYGWDEDIGEEDIVRELFKLYHRIAERR